MCGLRTRPRTDVDPPRVELPSAGVYRLAAPGAITCSQWQRTVDILIKCLRVRVQNSRDEWWISLHCSRTGILFRICDIECSLRCPWSLYSPLGIATRHKLKSVLYDSVRHRSRPNTSYTPLPKTVISLCRCIMIQQLLYTVTSNCYTRCALVGQNFAALISR